MIEILAIDSFESFHNISLGLASSGNARPGLRVCLMHVFLVNSVHHALYELYCIRNNASSCMKLYQHIIHVRVILYGEYTN